MEERVIFLWFGSWKNAEMMYTPEWVKRDLNRFQRAQIVKSEAKSMREMRFVKIPSYSISYLCEEACEAERAGFLSAADVRRDPFPRDRRAVSKATGKTSTCKNGRTKRPGLGSSVRPHGKKHK